MGNFKSELSNYQNVPRELVFDKTLSDRARFVYVFMACKPDGWDFYLEPMAKDIGYSVETLRKYINELVTSGWLIKGEQSNEHGIFGAVEYTLKATKFTDTENFRHGKNTAQDNKDINNNITTNNINKEKDTIVSKKEIFEDCWAMYNRKGSKKKAYEQWCKLKDDDYDKIKAHIPFYVKSNERIYLKDFERYLSYRVFESVVIDKHTGQVTYDPERESGSVGYNPQCGGSLMWNEQMQCYLFIGWYTDGDDIPDGYTSENRPDGAEVMLNNARGTLVWSRGTKEWRKK